MLHLVRPSTSVPTLRSVALVDIDVDLSRYLEDCLRTRWPQVRISRLRVGTEGATAEHFDLHLRIDERRPPATFLTLWLGDLERSHRAVRLSPLLWRVPTPITGNLLVRLVETMLRESG